MHSSRMRTARSSSHLLGGCLPQCMLGYPLGVGLETHPCVGLETPPVWAWRPPWVWAWRPLQARPLNFPLGCGPGDLQGMLGYHLQCMLEYHPPPVDRILDTRF